MKIAIPPFIKRTSLILLIGGLLNPIYGQRRVIEGTEKLDPPKAIQELSHRYWKIMLKKDYEGYVSLLHPKVQSCINSDNQFYFNHTIHRDFRAYEDAKPNYKIDEFVRLPKDYEDSFFELLNKKGLYLTVRSTHMLALSGEKTVKKDNEKPGITSHRGIHGFISLVKDDKETYYINIACPDQEKLDEIKKSKNFDKFCCWLLCSFAVCGRWVYAKSDSLAVWRTEENGGVL